MRLTMRRAGMASRWVREQQADLVSISITERLADDGPTSCTSAQQWANTEHAHHLYDGWCTAAAQISIPKIRHSVGSPLVQRQRRCTNGEPTLNQVVCPVNCPLLVIPSCRTHTRWGEGAMTNVSLMVSMYYVTLEAHTCSPHRFT